MIDTARTFYQHLLFRYTKETCPEDQSSRYNATLHRVLKIIKDFGEKIRFYEVPNSPRQGWFFFDILVRLLNLNHHWQWSLDHGLDNHFWSYQTISPWHRIMTLWDKFFYYDIKIFSVCNCIADRFFSWTLVIITLLLRFFIAHKFWLIMLQNCNGDCEIW